MQFIRPMNPWRTTRLLALLTVLALPFAAAQDDQQQQTQERSAALRIAHLAPEGPTVSVRVNDETLIESLAPNSVSGYLFLPPGDHQLEVVSGAAPAPAEEQPAQEGAAQDGGAAQPADPAQPADQAQEAPAAEAEPLVSQSVTLDADTYATLALASSGAAAEEGEAQEQIQLQARLMTDTFESLPGAGRSLVRVIHAAPSEDQVTVVVSQSEGEQPSEQEQQEGEQDEQQPEEQQEGPAPVEGNALASGLAFGDGGEYADLLAGSYRVQVQRPNGEVAVDLTDLQFEAGVVYTLFVAGTQDGENLVLTPAVDGGVRAQGR